MGDRTHIEWTDATWNPVTGCDRVSPGCDHCYAEAIAHRFAGTKAYPSGFAVTLRPERLDIPLRWRRPRRVFVNSMSDLFHQAIPDDYIARVFAGMAAAPQHTFQVLTKRHARMRSLLSSDAFDLAVADAWADLHTNAGTAGDGCTPPWPLPNVWLGVSVEDQHWADIRIPALVNTPAAVRFLSCEPLLGRLDLAEWTAPHVGECRRNLLRVPPWCTCGRDDAGYLDWVIVGGESGPGARPMQPDWARSIRDKCVRAGVPFLFKQWGEWAPSRSTGVGIGSASEVCVPDSSIAPLPNGVQEGCWMHRVGKRAAGRDLDGRTWDEYPP